MTMAEHDVEMPASAPSVSAEPAREPVKAGAALEPAQANGVPAIPSKPDQQPVPRLRSSTCLSR